MSLDNIDEQPDPEAVGSEPDAAFSESAEMIFLGTLLKPSRRRVEYAAQALGNKVLSGRANFEMGGLYDGFTADMICMLYLCICAESEVMLCHTKPERFLSLALAWGEENAIGMGLPAYEKGSELYWKILEQINKSAFRIKETPGGSSGPGNE